MKKLNYIAIATTTVCSLATGTAVADIAGNIGVTSNYIFRGVSLSTDNSAVSGGLDYSNENGFYAGAWASSYTDDYELDLYGGFGGEAGAISYDIGWIQYMYPNSANDPSFDYGELYASVTYEFFTVGFAYTAQSDTDDTDGDAEAFIEGDLYYYVNGAWDLQDDWSMGLTLGIYTFDNDGDSNDDGSRAKLDYNHIQVDVNKSVKDFGDFSFALSLADDDQGGEGINDELIPYVSWIKSF
jgi:uncharacterized protein (TIGR02001 family)